MGINLTLIVQMLVFGAFVWFTMRFVWPPLAKALEERQNKIAAGLDAAERARKELELTQHRVIEDLKQAKEQAAKIIDEASKRGAKIVEIAHDDAKLAAQKQTKIAQEQLQQEVNRAKDSLRREVANLAIAGAEAILGRQIDDNANSKLLDNLIEEI